MELRSNPLYEMAYPAGFDMNLFSNLKTFSDRVKYAESTLPLLGKGSARMVYAVDEDKVLKLAYNMKGISQNRAEADPDLHKYGLFAEIYSAHPKLQWIEMERAEPVTEEDFDKALGDLYALYIPEECYGMPAFTYLHHYIAFLYMRNMGVRKPLASTKRRMMEYAGIDIELLWRYFRMLECSDKYPGSLFHKLRRYMKDSNLHVYGDLVKLSSWGKVKRKGKDMLVIIDYGFNDDVCLKHYKKRAV